MNMSPDMTVGELAARHPATVKVFDTKQMSTEEAELFPLLDRMTREPLKAQERAHLALLRCAGRPRVRRCIERCRRTDRGTVEVRHDDVAHAANAALRRWPVVHVAMPPSGGGGGGAVHIEWRRRTRCGIGQRRWEAGRVLSTGTAAVSARTARR